MYHGTKVRLFIAAYDFSAQCAEQENVMNSIIIPSNCRDRYKLLNS